jgi:hypothetical protein
MRASLHATGIHWFIPIIPEFYSSKVTSRRYKYTTVLDSLKVEITLNILHYLLGFHHTKLDSTKKKSAELQNVGEMEGRGLIQGKNETSAPQPEAALQFSSELTP